MPVDTLRTRRASSIATAVLTLGMLMPALPGVRPVAAQTALPPIVYNAELRLITVGTDYSPADPAQAPYVEYPSHPQAPKQRITLAQIDAALTAQGQPDLITSTGRAWMLRTDMMVLETAQLVVDGTYASELKLESNRIYPDGSERQLPLTKLVARGGAMKFDGVHVYASEDGTPDTTYYDGRSFLLAENGGRMDVLNAEISHLGWGDGEPSGLSWRKMGMESGDPTRLDHIRTGSTGSILNSRIHDMYFGQYSYEAYGLVVKNSEFYDNLYYGFDPHDYSTNFEVAYNKVYNNGKHGIIFSRGCVLNRIHHNEVWGNKEHGIMLDRGSNNNQIYENTVYNNSDGIAIFQSEKNIIRDNMLTGNERGVRINATYDRDDEYDGLANDNVVLNNTIRDSTQYGIYLYERADKNTIEGNLIEGSAASGVYVKTGGNAIRGNIVRTNDNGITIVSVPEVVEPPTGKVAYIFPSYQGGYKNVIVGNTITDNDAVGIQLKGAVDTTIGPDGPNPKASDANTISTNGSHGISLDTGATKNVIRGNTIHANVTDGILAKGDTTIKNLFTRNSITANGRMGINLQTGANEAVPTPKITSAAGATTVTGKIEPMQAKYQGGMIEVYRDATGQGKTYLGQATLKNDGTWSFALPTSDNAQNGQITALFIDKYRNTSMFGGNTTGGAAVSYVIGTGANGETTVYVSGPGANVTIPDIARALKVISPTTDLLVQESATEWLSNASLFINRGVTLTLGVDTVTVLKLRSQDTDITLSAMPESYNYQSFTTLRTYNGSILINGTPNQRITITSWNPAQNGPDTNYKDGRSYLLAKYNARMDITYADVQYLGSPDGESYGASWRDINSSDAPDTLLTRVTGKVTDSTFSHNYYGIYTFQARDMTFLRNKFHTNIGYGFDPHDYSTNFLVEDNEAFANGNHGFIISRGCNNFVFRRNKSYNNAYTVGDADRRAHGFMIDPGSPNSQFAQVPSFNNLFEDNEAYGNDGYGMRIVGSNTNTIRKNRFTSNYQGITLEEGSTGNVISGNTITGSTLYGVYLFSAADVNTVTANTISGSGKHGIYIKTGRNTITGNTVTGNGSIVDGLTSGSGIATLRESTLFAAAADMTPAGATVDVASFAAETQSEKPASEVEQNVISGNTVTRNADEGIELKGAMATRVEKNTVAENGANGIYITSGSSTTMVMQNDIRNNTGYGIRANGSDVFGNTWTRNAVYDNRSGGIINTSDANDDIAPPTLTRNGTEVTGTTRPNATVEIYSDSIGQGRTYETSVKADAEGNFRIKRGWKGAIVNAFATDADGNSSGFAKNVAAGRTFQQVFIPLIRR